jgi:hypothetical protein
VAELDADVAEAEPEAEGDGETGVLLGVLVGSVLDDVGAVGEAELEELEEGEGEGDGDVDVGSGVAVGVGVAEAAAGSTWHVMEVFGPALAEVLGLGLGLVLGVGLAETATVFIVPAHAAPGQPASAPRVRDPPATRLTTAARACARRMKTALFPLLFEVYWVLFVGFVGDCVTVGYEYSYPVPGELCLRRHMPLTAGPPGGSAGRPSDVTIVTPRSVPLSSEICPPR